LTPEDLCLDTAFFRKNQPLTLYRLARARYANLSGAGAALYPGRWNRLGQEAIYTSTEMAVPVLERLAHTSKELIPSNLALMKIRVSGNWEHRKEGLVDSLTRACLIFHPILANATVAFQIPQLFGEGLNPIAVAVPSTIVPVWNVVLYPQVFGFWDHVTLESVEALKFDPRPVPEHPPLETPE